MFSRLWRCRPGGSAGFDPVPDIHHQHHTLTPWRYGRWTGRHMPKQWQAADRDRSNVQP